MSGTLGPSSVSTKLRQVAEQARKYPQTAWTTLAHHIEVEWLREAYRRTRKDGAAGVDGQTAAHYAENLEGNLRDLHERFKSGTYYAPPVRRGYVPKGDGKALGEAHPRPRLGGRAFMIRYADDAVLCFERGDDARRVMEVLAKRLARFGLTLHPQKTRMLDFRRPRGGEPSKSPDDPHGRQSFEMLGFTHHWARSRKGAWVIKRKTSPSRFGRALKRISQWCRRHRHETVARQHAVLVQKLRGHYAYFGITGNWHALSRFRNAGADLAEVVGASLRPQPHAMGSLQPPARALPASARSRRAQHLPSRSESVV